MDFLVFVLAPQLLHGLVWGMALVLVAVGLTVIFGLMGVVNFAHGELYMLGAYFSYTLLFIVPDFWVAAALAVVSVAVLGWLAERLVFRPLYGRNPIFHLLLTFGLGLVLREAARLIWGASTRSIDAPISGSVQMLGVIYPMYRLAILVLSAVIMLGIFLFIAGTRIGAMIRAAAEDREMLAVLGVNVDRLFGWVFAAGAGLAALSGALMAPIVHIYPRMGLDVVVLSFIVVIVGGLGSIRGAVVAGLLMGEFISLGSIWFSPVYSETAVFGFLILILVVRPTGLFGENL